MYLLPVKKLWSSEIFIRSFQQFVYFLSLKLSFGDTQYTILRDLMHAGSLNPYGIPQARLSLALHAKWPAYITPFRSFTVADGLKDGGARLAARKVRRFRQNGRPVRKFNNRGGNYTAGDSRRRCRFGRAREREKGWSTCAPRNLQPAPAAAMRRRNRKSIFERYRMLGGTDKWPSRAPNG